jgi:predicted DNA-binding transcriptional regulator YafY
VRLEYQKEGDDTWTERRVEPYELERRLPHWYVHTWDLDRDAARSFRVDRTRNVEVTKDEFARRDDFDAHELGGARAVKVLYLPEIARWKVEKGARPLADGSAVADLAAGSADWLVSEILADRGYAVVVEPADLRKLVAARAKELAAGPLRLAARRRARAG